MHVLEPVQVLPAHGLDVLLQKRRQPAVVRDEIDIVAIADVLADLLLAARVEARGLDEVIDVLLGAFGAVGFAGGARGRLRGLRGLGRLLAYLLSLTTLAMTFPSP